ncbi:MAG: hypothetical protein A2Z21_05580 [Candidatus Fraserbacteria bacterium RBG_16_55_9]|uniref:Sulfotransferase domain-containing protein n=1 Tax=Fraserbacteria sp. (strain RBG_16_55_9) TaxID=1817864 RepID=A0A1F5UPX5_FRAXR|nr:MAG: hypothetical protein A2Z21_05580 [Candidatus Fraserbacteria bacterium RBG_16_55_9]
MRSGTTWLYGQLRTHPELYLPDKKEVHFFDRNYTRGLGWYEKFFPSPEEAGAFRGIGEITPRYICDPQVPHRIHEHLPRCRFIAILRNPVDRAYSHYTRALRAGNYAHGFQEYLDRRPDVFDRGLYSMQLERYLTYFPRENFLILIFERVMSNPERALQQAAEFLAVDPRGFDGHRMKRKMNASYPPRMSSLYTSARRTEQFLQSKNLKWLLKVLDNVKITKGAKKLFELVGSKVPLPRMDASIRAKLFARYEADIAALERLLGEDLSIWKGTFEKSGAPEGT